MIEMAFVSSFFTKGKFPPAVLVNDTYDIVHTINKIDIAVWSYSDITRLVRVWFNIKEKLGIDTFQGKGNVSGAKSDYNNDEKKSKGTLCSQVILPPAIAVII
jgi:hypothetical protein